MRPLARRLWTTALFGWLWAGPTLVCAAEEAGAEAAPHAGNPWVALLFKFLNLAILAAILYKALKKTVVQGLADRSESVRKELHEARAAKEAAERKYRDYRAKVSHLEDEIRALRDEFRAEGERQKERILREAAEAVDAVARQAAAAGANEVKKAKDELRLELADLSMRLAEELLTQAYTADDQKKAVQQTIHNVERVH